MTTHHDGTRALDGEAGVAAPALGRNGMYATSIQPDAAGLALKLANPLPIANGSSTPHGSGPDDATAGKRSLLVMHEDLQ